MPAVLLRKELIPGEIIDGVPDTILFGIAAGVFLLVLLAVVLVLRSRRRHRRAEPPVDTSMAWGDAPPFAEPAVTEAPSFGTAAFSGPTSDALAAAPAPGQVYHCRCPACQTQFTVNGAKPIVTNCPGCGKKGYLR